MRLHLSGYDVDRGGYLVTRSYSDDGGRWPFAWFVVEMEAQRFIEIMRPLSDAMPPDKPTEGA